MFKKIFQRKTPTTKIPEVKKLFEGEFKDKSELDELFGEALVSAETGENNLKKLDGERQYQYGRDIYPEKNRVGHGVMVLEIGGKTVVRVSSEWWDENNKPIEGTTMEMRDFVVPRERAIKLITDIQSRQGPGIEKGY